MNEIYFIKITYNNKTIELKYKRSQSAIKNKYLQCYKLLMLNKFVKQIISHSFMGRVSYAGCKYKEKPHRGYRALQPNFYFKLS